MAYGNYQGYYQYRLEDCEDSRFHILKKEYFINKKCLDIGCNAGAVTIRIFEDHKPRYMVGIDRDKILVKKAQQNLKKIRAISDEEEDKRRTVDNTSSSDTDAEGAASSENIAVPGVPFAAQTTTINRTLLFRQENIITERRHQLILCCHPGIMDFECMALDSYRKYYIVYTIQVMHKDHSYDTITCLSVVKWIHLTYGDDGLLSLFRKAHRLLKPGGLFILEFQSWKSYKKKKSLCRETEKMYASIEMRPDSFEQVLSSEIGFTFVENLGKTVHSKKGFRRHILLCTK
uniref:RNA methyltransferase n=1 Tax=Heterosigma akashiwo TaxID=2829 RepID=A0A7S3UV33_HETAK